MDRAVAGVTRRLAGPRGTGALAAAASIVLLAGCGDAGETATPASDTATHPDSRSIDAVADDYLAAYLDYFPIVATFRDLPGFDHDRLRDNSAAGLTRWQTTQDRLLAELEAIGEPADIGSRDWISWGILHHELSSAVAARVCRVELWEVSTTTAWHTSLPFVFDAQPVATDADREQALDRLRAVVDFLRNETDNLRRGLELGYSSPRVTVEKVPEQIRSLLDEGNPFTGMASRSEDPAFADTVGDVFAGEVAPAIRAFADFVEDEYLPAAREELSIAGNPDGAACYSARVRYFATVAPSADEIHRLGLEQIAGIRAEMQALIDREFGGGDIESFLQRVSSDPQFTFETEQAVLDYSNAALDAAEQRMPDVFGRLPKADVIIRPYPDFAASGVGEYHEPSVDGSRPGIFYISVRDPQNRSKASQLSTLYHETWPGHHLHSALALELGDSVHPVAGYLWNSGFGEGWALYSERLMQELDMYPDPIDEFGLLSDQAARAVRLVIDTGLHTKGWTRQQAVDYMVANTTWARVDIESDIDRYISWPGQANAYMLGMLEIRRLRTLAEDTLGEEFDLRAFHDLLLEDGGLTLPMLDRKVRAWIDERD